MRFMTAILVTVLSLGTLPASADGNDQSSGTVGSDDSGVSADANVGGNKGGGGGDHKPNRRNRQRPPQPRQNTSTTAKHVCTSLTRTGPPPPASENTVTETQTNPDGTTQSVQRTYQTINIPCGAGTYSATTCIKNCPTGAPPADQPPDPYETANQAANQTPWITPTPRFSPNINNPNTKPLVGLPLYYAIPPEQFRPIYAYATACNGTACTHAWSKATPTAIHFTPDDNTPTITTCTRPGEIIRTQQQAKTAGTSCAHTYQTRGTYNTTITIHYTITGGINFNNNPNNPDDDGGDPDDNGGDPPFNLGTQNINTQITITIHEYQPIITK
jgi:hypothetical protein